MNGVDVQVLAKSGSFCLTKRQGTYKVVEGVRECSSDGDPGQAVISCWKKSVGLTDQSEWVDITYNLWKLLRGVKPELDERDPIGVKVVKSDYAVQFEYLEADGSLKVKDYVTERYYRQTVLQHEAFEQEVSDGAIVVDYQEGLKELDRVLSEFYCIEEKKDVYYCVRTEPIIRTKEEAISVVGGFLNKKVDRYQKSVYRLAESVDPGEVAEFLSGLSYVEHCERVGVIPAWEERFVFQGDGGDYEVVVNSCGYMVLRTVPYGQGVR